jgi:hypothetical protein
MDDVAGIIQREVHRFCKEVSERAYLDIGVEDRQTVSLR